MDYFNFLSVVSLLKKKKSGRIKQSHFINVHCEICASYAWFCETKELKGVNNNVLHSYCLVFHLHHILAHEKTRKGLNSTSAAQFAVQPLVKPVVWFARVVVNGSVLLLNQPNIWFSYIHNFIIILSRVYNEPIQRPVCIAFYLVNSSCDHCMFSLLEEVKPFTDRTDW